MLSLSMGKQLQKLIRLLSVILLIQLPIHVVWAQANDAELSLESELDQSSGSQPNTTQQDSLTLDSELSLDSSSDNSSAEQPATATLEPVETPVQNAPPAQPENKAKQAPPPDGMSSAYVDDEPVEDFEEDFAMNGYSIGLLALTQTFSVKAAMKLTAGGIVDLSSDSTDFQSAGLNLRYAIMPFNRIGTDLNFSLGTTVNNESVNYSSITFAKALLNLGYAIPWGKDNNSLYFLLGGGYEYISGSDIQKVLAPGGGTYQAGVGLGLGRKTNIEVFYAFSSHALNNEYIDQAGAIAISKGAAGYEPVGDRKVTSASIIGRLNYNF